MTSVDLLRTLLIPIIVFLRVMSLALWWPNRFGRHIYSFVAGLSRLLAWLLMWMAAVVDDPLKGPMIWFGGNFSRARVPDVRVLCRCDHQQTPPDKRQTRGLIHRFDHR